ncbi:beta-aspartyl-peptidase (threonine type) [Halalkaliarchaeum desulfuricum]|uniref:Plant-type L-asparaginase n=1 Tax=Halalkaliarchaeum desulfuricum TaxID=2055893 RepID=A0A343TKM3_9EURY|nr:isoaspartyl peptidase/L-asparaginase [Halalkaliarchaeum desulfuricum]AUX09645.1 beta-aspartyl-peptidase (threonine type) [Halalkaliarchaeum desulfuricum]
MRVIVHGGAGSTPEEPDERQAVLDEAAAVGAASPEPIDAVEAAVRVLESDERFNAGVGGAVQADGIVRTDAGVMRSDREVGAACSMPGVEHAVSVARIVLEATPHVLVSGVHAVDLAADFGVGTEAELLTADKRESYQSEDPPAGSPRDQIAWLASRFGAGDDQAGEHGEGGSGPTHAPDHDTVGAVASDGETFAAATSTGGRSYALAGRVGDVPQVGSGFYCTPAGGASATGAGEDIARVTLSRRATDFLEEGLGAQEAADRAIEEFEELTGSGAGVIVLDGSEAGSAFNTGGMQTSVAVDR